MMLLFLTDGRYNLMKFRPLHVFTSTLFNNGNNAQTVRDLPIEVCHVLQIIATQISEMPKTMVPDAGAVRSVNSTYHSSLMTSPRHSK